MNNSGIEEYKAHIMVELIDYVPNTVGEGAAYFQGTHFQNIEYASNAVAVKTILRKVPDNVSPMPFNPDNGSAEKTSPFDTFAQIIEGKGEIVIDGKSHLLENGQGIVIPAHQPHFIIPNGQFKIILTLIKGGYD